MKIKKLNKTWYKVGRAMLMTALVGLTLVNLFYIGMNPQLTMTQVLFKCWHSYLTIVGCAFVLVFVEHEDTNKKIKEVEEIEAHEHRMTTWFGYTTGWHGENDIYIKDVNYSALDKLCKECTGKDLKTYFIERGYNHEKSSVNSEPATRFFDKI